MMNGMSNACIQYMYLRVQALLAHIYLPWQRGAIGNECSMVVCPSTIIVRSQKNDMPASGTMFIFRIRAACKIFCLQSKTSAHNGTKRHTHNRLTYTHIYNTHHASFRTCGMIFHETQLMHCHKHRHTLDAQHTFFQHTDKHNTAETLQICPHTDTHAARIYANSTTNGYTDTLLQTQRSSMQHAHHAQLTSLCGTLAGKTQQTIHRTLASSSRTRQHPPTQ